MIEKVLTPQSLAFTEEVPIESEDDIIEFRQIVRTLALEQRFDSFAVAALTTAASELSRNIWAHAKTGTATVEIVQEGKRYGIRMEFSDQGPGIKDINRVLKGGFSTADSLGFGISGSKRLVDEFEIQSAPGQGTKIKVIKWNRIL